MKKTSWYNQFVDFNYKPSRNDLIALFYFEPDKNMTKKEAVGRIASESSTGTWTTLTKMPPRMKKIMATVFEIKGNFAKIAYPLDLWELGNSPQLLSGIAGNIFGMKALKNLRLVDVSFPEKYTKSFKGPKYGIDGIKKILKVKGRPITGAVVKPKVGFSAVEHSKVAFETWMGGFDLVKDDENLTSMTFNKFSDRVKAMAKMRDKAEHLTGERKEALMNITNKTSEMKKRASLLHDYGFRFAMIDVVVSGVSSVEELRDYCGNLNMAIHAHRAMHAAFDRNPKHGITMYFIAKLMRIIGVDQIHVGTAVGKLVGSKREVLGIADMIRDNKVNEVRNEKLFQKWGSIKGVSPASSGGLHPGLVPDVMDIFGVNFALLVSGGIHGHPDGTRAGAKAVRQAIDSTLEGIKLEKYAKTHKELSRALGKWGRLRPE